ncbi:MAG: hypothetical protein AAGC53_03705 [Actinomycetota bacterium]
MQSSTSDPGAQLEQYKTLNTTLVVIGNFLLQDAPTLEEALGPDHQKELSSIVKALYETVQVVNENAVVPAIEALKAEPPTTPEIELPPLTVPPWEEGSPPDFFLAIWQTIEGPIEMGLRRVSGTTKDSPAFLAFTALVSDGQRLAELLDGRNPGC